jgi:hypothetical protein
VQVCDAIFADCHGAGTVAWDQVSPDSTFAIKRDSTALSWQPKFGGPSQDGGGVLSNRGVQQGRHYWEISMRGYCWIVGVADNLYRPIEVPIFSTHSWTCGDIRSYNLSTNFQQIVSASTGELITIGVALDATSGSVWFSRNGVWLNGGDPASAANPLRIMKGYSSLHPIVGAWSFNSQYCADGNHFSANFGGSSFQYSIPSGFLRLQTDECDCSKSYVKCLDSSGCSGPDGRYVTMISRLPKVCGFHSQYISNPLECTSGVPKKCDAMFQSCTRLTSNQVCTESTDQLVGGCNVGCECLEAWFECMWQGNCTLDANGVTEYGDLCLRLGCSSKQCGKFFRPLCNVSTMLCSKEFLKCQESLPTSSKSCSCLALYYNCVERERCFTPESLSTHELVCIDQGCSEIECGYPATKEFQYCNTTQSAACDNKYMSCLAKPETLSRDLDPCFQSYSISSKAFGLIGPTFCNDSIKRGYLGCAYDHATDSCFTSSICACVGDYYRCETKSWCMTAVDKERYSLVCDQLGCTAKQCGLSFTTCNRTGSTLCGGKYLECDKRVNKYSRLLPSNYSNPSLGCFSSYCLWEWRLCMLSANCTDLDTISDSANEYISECQSVLGCSLDICKLALIQDTRLKPDSPVALTAKSLPGEQILVVWNNSLNAIEWALMNSGNIIIAYNISIFDTSISTARLIQTWNVEFDSLTEVRFSGLVIGNRYTIYVSALNMFGEGPAVTITERMLGLPSEPQELILNRVGPLQVLGLWKPPKDFGDKTQERQLLGYIVSILLDSDTLDSADTNGELNVSGLSTLIDSNTFTLYPGDTVSMQVRAVNAIGVGKYSQVSHARVMGLPSLVVNPSTVELKSGILVKWLLPIDTGFGDMDLTLIPKFTIEVNQISLSNSSGLFALVRIQVVTKEVCNTEICSYVISQQDILLVEEAVYQLRVYTSNEVGSNEFGAEAIIQGWRIKTKPSVPLNVIGVRKPGVPLQMQVSWTTPVNTGDGTDSYSKFNGYVVQVWDHYSYKWAMKRFDKFTLLVLIGSNISGTNTFDLQLFAGQVVKAQVAASNDKGLGLFSAPVSALMVGLPSVVQSPSAVEEIDGIRLFWSAPADQGQGIGRVSYDALMFSPISVSGYRVVACKTTCENAIEGFVSASEGISLYQYFFVSSILGIQQQKVYFDIFALNVAGLGHSVCPTYCIGQSPPKGILVGWKITPTIIFPTISPTQMLQIAERVDRSTNTVLADIWDIDSQARYAALPITVQDFPLLTKGTVLLMPVTKGSVVNSGRVQVGTVNKDGMAFASDPSGIGSLTIFNLEAPVFSTGSGNAIGNLFIQTNPTKAVSVYMNYFSYPSTVLVQVSPTRGPVSGGTRVTVTIFEPLGFKTRHGSGLLNFYNSDLGLIKLRFGGSPASLISRIVNSIGQQSNVVLNALIPSGVVGLAEIEVQVGDAAALQSSFQYRDAYLFSLAPTSALQSERFIITATISDIGEINTNFTSSQITVAGIACSNSTVVRTMTVDIGNKPENQAVVTGMYFPPETFPSNILPGQSYAAELVVTLIKSGGLSIIVRDTGFLRLFIPNVPRVISSTVAGTGKSIPISQPTLISIQVRFLSPQDTIRVFFGDHVGTLAGCQQIPCICPNPCSQYQGGLNDNYLTTISVLSPIIPSISISPVELVVSIRTGKLNLYVRSLRFISFEYPTIYAVQPSEARESGGTILLIGLSGFCDTPGCVPSGFNAIFNGIKGKSLGFVSLKSWEQKDDAFYSLILAPELSRINAGFRISDLRAVQSVSDEVAQSTSGLLTKESAFLLFVEASAVPTLMQLYVNMTIQATDDTEKISSASVLFFPKPSGSASGVISPSQIYLADLSKTSVNLLVSLQRFLVCYDAAELQVVFASSDGSISIEAKSNLISIQSSSSSGTNLRLNLPPCGPDSILQCTSGKFLVTIFPKVLPANSAVFQLEILDVINALDPTPSTVYSSGGDLIEVVWTGFYVPGMSRTDVRITVVSGDGKIKPGDEPCPNTNEVSGTCTFVFTASSIVADQKNSKTTVAFVVPAVPYTHGRSLTSSTQALQTGVATVGMLYLVTGQTTAPFSFTYIAFPIGIPVFQFYSPTQGSQEGGFQISFKLTNFRRVVNISNLIVKFDSTQVVVIRDTFLSGYTFTAFSVLAPASERAGFVNVKISNSVASGEDATTLFNFFNPYRAVLKYPAGPPWPFGDSGLDNTLRVVVNRLGAVVGLSNFNITSAGIQLSLPKAIAVSQVISSTLQQTDILISIPQVPDLKVTTNVNITVLISVRSSLQMVTFGYTFVAQGSPYVISFIPGSYFTDGGVPMDITVANFPSLSGITFQFAPDMKIVNVTSVRAIKGTQNARIIITIPPTLREREISPIVLQGSVQIPFPSTFVFQAPPAITIQRFFPQRGQIRQANSVTLTLLNFPGVSESRISDVVIKFGASSTEATTISVSRVDTSLAQMAVQTIIVVVLSPLFIYSDVVNLQAYHRKYEDRIAFSTSYFQFYDPDQPSILDVSSGIIGKIPGVVYVRTTTTTRVVISLLHVPRRNSNLLATEMADLPVYVNNVQVFPSKFIMIEDSSAMLVIQTAPQANPGDVKGLIYFGTNDRSNFPDIPLGFTLSFTLQYYDDSTPQLTVIAPSTGSELGGDLVQLTIKGFPVMSQTIQALVQIVSSQGGSTIYANIITIDASDSSETLFTARMPAFPVATGTETVIVSVASAISESKITNGLNFHYNAVLPSIRSAFPSSGSKNGGTILYMTLANFPSSSLPVRVVFRLSTKDVELLESAGLTTTADSASNQVFLQIFTPPSSPGLVDIVAFSAVSGKSSSVKFTFQFIDDDLPALDAPYPTKGCIAVDGVPASIFIKKATSPDSIAAITASVASVTFSMLPPISAQSVISLRNDKVQIVVLLPKVADPTVCTMSVTLGSYMLPETLVFEFVDCSATTIFGFYPKSVLNLGGSPILLKVRNLDASVLNSSLLKATLGERQPVALVIQNFQRSSFYTFVTVTTPALPDIIGPLNLNLVYTVGGLLSKISCTITLLAPCDLDTLCSQQNSLIVAVHSLLLRPPGSDACLPDYVNQYCLPASGIPFPRLLLLRPSRGLVGIAHEVTASIASFPSLIMTANNRFQTTAAAKISLQVGIRSLECTIINISRTGPSFLSQEVTIAFIMPGDTDIPDGSFPLTMTSYYGTTGKALSKTVSRSITTTYRYISPVTGTILVTESYPPSCIASDCPSTSVWVKLSNFPYYEMQPPYDLARFAVFIGTSSCSVSQIQSSNALFTLIEILLPSNMTDIPAGSNATVTVMYRPFARFTSGCSRVILGLCADRAATFILQLIPDPSPLLLSLFPTEIQIGSRRRDRLISLKVAYLPKQVSLADLDACLVNPPGFTGSNVEMVVPFVIDPTLFVQSNPRDLAPNCARDSCSLFELVIIAPTSLPAAMSRDVVLRICLLSRRQCVQSALTFVNFIVTEYPSSVQVPPGAQESVDLYISGFEYLSSRSCTQFVTCQQVASFNQTCPCYCGQLLVNCLPFTLCSVQPSLLSFQNGPIFQAKVQLPTVTRFGLIQMMLMNVATGAQASFEIKFLQPPPLVVPVDYPLGGTTRITVTAYWGLVTKPVLVIFPRGVRFNATAAGTDLFSSHSVVRFTPPITASQSAAIVSVTLQAASAVQVFNLQFFMPPAVQAIEPNQVL